MSKFGNPSTIGKMYSIGDTIKSITSNIAIQNKENWIKVYEMMKSFLNDFELEENHSKETLTRIVDLKEIKVPPTNFHYTGYIDLNYKEKDTLLCNLNVLEIDSFYPTIMVSLLKKGIIKEKGFDKLYEVLLIILNDYKIFKVGTESDIKYYNFYKEWINRTFGYLSKENQNIVLFYSREIIKDILKGIEGWIYVDTDVIYYYGNINYDNISKDLNNLSFRTSNVYFGYFKSKKNYIIYDDNGLCVKGFRKVGETIEERENIINDINRLKREENINNLLN
jgi:hypothetical protein